MPPEAPSPVLSRSYGLLRPLLFSLDAERAHRLTLGLAALAPRLGARLARGAAPPIPPGLARRVAGLPFAGPVGLAAGLDKDGVAVPLWPALGFGFVEIGTVTALAQPGNPRPRLFRLPAERALVNRLGFNNRGSEALARRLGALKASGRWPAVPVGVNVGKSRATPLDAAEADYATSIRRLAGRADYFTVNVSSPNTPGLRQLQEADRLRRLLPIAVAAAAGTPVFLKLSPDLAPADLETAVELAVEAGLAGLIATNTTIERPGLAGAAAAEAGGLSGRPLWPLARRAIGRVLAAAAGRLPVIGVGGVESAAQVAELLAAGCAAVQLYTALIYEGPGLPVRLHRELAVAQSLPK